ncbi:glycerol-3-phosphate acyltransferase 1, mitochondrial isoform X1 [Anopheles stephensi]|uniref:glycerol-3-phosphate acyltransferase 1, mitochondrial isoform X1 n=2 Tax=Anopheles stephensi TaxID=30069 RepID=UPI0007D536F7|nr:glycerol-3-phosphate acyltransferase 1, mitochondrial isoform X1 [Anopheles stephensi]
MLGILEVLLFLCIIGYFFNKERAIDMVDIISNRVQEAYGSFRLPSMFAPGTDTQQNGGFSTYSMLKRFGEAGRRQRELNADIDRQVRQQSLFHIKEMPITHVQPELKPIPGMACPHCSPTESRPQLDADDRRRHAIDILRVTTHAGEQYARVNNPGSFDWGVWCPHLAQATRVRRFSYPQVAGAVLPDERVQEALDMAAKESINDKRAELGVAENDESFDEDSYYSAMLRNHERRAGKILIGMRSKISNLVLRITSWVLYKLLPCFMSGVAAHPAQVEMIKRAIEKHPDVPLIFLPLHRSHLDYIMVSFILLNNDIKCPLVAGGDNLRIPVFGSILRYDGAFFIKRKIDPLTGKKDHVYRAILHTYLQKCLTAGHNVEFFIEGGRTRTGKPCMPKSGILSVIVDAFNDKSISDALIVPVSINYEKLVDGNFVREQLGQKKIPESFASAASAIMKVLKARYGLMRIDFNEPFSLSELVKSLRKSDTAHNYTPEMRRLQHKPSSSSLFGTDVVQEEQDQRQLIDNIARHVVYDSARATSVMTTNALAFLLLNRFRDGAPLSILVEALDELRAVLNGVRDLGFTGSSDDVIRYAADLLGPGLVSKEMRNGQLFIKPVVMIPNVIELSYYSNCLIPHFALESIVVTCATLLKRETERKANTDRHDHVEEVTVGRRALLEMCMEFAELLMYEFILCKPCQKLETVIENTLQELCLREILLQPEREFTEEQMMARKLARNLECDGLDVDDEELDDYFDDQHNSTTHGRFGMDEDDTRIHFPAEKHCDRLVLQSVLAPFTNTYSAVASSLHQLLDGNSIVESEFIRLCIKEISTRVELGDCKYGESISTDTVRNCLKVFQKRSYIEITNNNGVRLVSLQAPYDTMAELQNIVQEVHIFVPV